MKIDGGPMGNERMNGMKVNDVRHVDGRRRRQSLVAPLFPINSTKNWYRKMYRLMLTIADAKGSHAQCP